MFFAFCLRSNFLLQCLHYALKTRSVQQHCFCCFFAQGGGCIRFLCYNTLLCSVTVFSQKPKIFQKKKPKIFQKKKPKIFLLFSYFFPTFFLLFSYFFLLFPTLQKNTHTCAKLVGGYKNTTPLKFSKTKKSNFLCLTDLACFRPPAPKTV